MGLTGTREASERSTLAFARVRGAAARVALSIALALSMVVAVPATALAFDGPRQDAYNAATASGLADDPYRILVTKIGDPEQTRPSAFWSGMGNNAASGEDSFAPFAVVFEQRTGNVADGALASSMAFDMHDGAGRRVGTAGVGPVLANASGAAADVWSGLESSTQSDWTYAFRLSPYSAQDTSTGDLRIAFAWHGCFATYFDSWEYAFDAVGATSGLSEDKQVKVGDTVAMSYYGGYDVGQTSRGTGYSVDFSDTSTTNTFGSALSILGDPSGAVYEAVVDEDGFARFDGPNSIQYGGNYAVSIKERADGEDPGEPDSWDASAAQDGSLIATVEANQDGATHTLRFEGAGAIRDYASASEAPWFAAYADTITDAVVGDGVTSIGAYALGLENLATVKGGNALATVGDRAFTGAFNLTGIDLSACTLASVSENSFGDRKDQIKTQRTVYVKDAASAKAMEGYTSSAASLTAVAVMNGGSFAADTVFESGKLAKPEREGYTFSTWTSDASLMHPASEWKPVTDYVLYARFSENSVVDEPEKYKGYQGLDQQIRLLDLNALPGSSLPNPDIMFYGEDDVRFDNRFTVPFNGYDDIVFAFGMARGNNANGGDGTYQMSFCLPYVSIVDADGNTVATYDDGNGLLKKFSIVFDGQDGKPQGFGITAVRVGVEAGSLPAGTYTLRFGKDFGANNGISFLGKNVDFRFVVDYPERYRLSYRYNAAMGTAEVAGIDLLSEKPVDVEIPETVEDPATGTVCKVTGIAAQAFASKATVATVSVPASVASIGDGSFSNMGALASVTVRSKGDGSLPVWGQGVFAGYSACVLYGYPTSTTPQAAAGYGNVTFASLEDGIYVNHAAVTDGDVVELTKDDPRATVTVVRDGGFVTSGFVGLVTNANVATHPGTGPYDWNELTGRANGEARLVIRTVAGGDFATLTVRCTGFDEQASTDRTPVYGYQGNGATVSLQNAGPLEGVFYDETSDYYDNYLLSPVAAEGALFSLAFGGPGSGWQPGHSGWQWGKYRERIDQAFSIVDEDGTAVATIGNGLYWQTLSTSPTIVLGVDEGVLVPGKTYTLVASKDTTGHNVAASLQKEARWTFAVEATDLSACAVSDVGPQQWTGLEVEPDVSVTIAVPEIRIWDEAAKADAVTPASTRGLEPGRDYEVSYSDNVDPGTATLKVTGTGSYRGTVSKTFAIEEPPADFAKLREAVASVQAYKDGLASSADGKDVAPGTDWATPENLAVLQAAIDKAQALADGGEATQKEADAALAELTAAQEEFDRTSKNTAAPTKIALSAAIAQASSELGGVAESLDGKDVVDGKVWATAAEKAVLQAAIDKARGVADDAGATQNDIDAAQRELASAKEDFFANVAHRASVDTTRLSQACEAAATDRAATKVSTDGSEVYCTEQWTSEADAAAFAEVIGRARVALAASGKTQNAVDAALAALSEATAAFDAAKKDGLRPDPRPLASAVERAAENLDSVVVASDASSVPTDTTWVTQETHDALSKALADARATLQDPNATQDDFDAARTALAEAVAAFDVAKQQGAYEQGGPVGDGSGSTPGESGASSGSGTALLKTGDGVAAAPIASLALLALAGLGCAALARRRGRNEA